MDTAEARTSFEEFVAARSVALGRTAYLLTGHRHDAEDLLQAALARAAVRWSRLDDAEAYVRRVLYTQSVSRWRQLRRRPPELLTDQPPHLAAPEPDRETRVVLDLALRRLTPKQRAVLVLRFYEDRSESQTAELLECSVGTVKSQTRHALARLRELNPQLAQLIDGRLPQEVTVR
ncbi:SigE family RNA polymerase sigma factor [Catellatospora tritici]|uniref:SigE family RNA polymerase sigma factor n=1 Tax=Catellatospora tritici TaxID=2851566 RepID=UPI001C2D6355|nr:SigE family RNA polymerase sigma factor [Catellatospora tritici]MBV1853046.1 SigE family RNA polymerase sigma factor [Catellatospora tritici]